MEVVKIDSQGRILIPKPIREKAGLVGEAELLQTDDGIVLRPRKLMNWQEVLQGKLKVDWKQALAVSLEGSSLDDIVFS